MFSFIAFIRSHPKMSTVSQAVHIFRPPPPFYKVYRPTVSSSERSCMQHIYCATTKIQFLTYNVITVDLLMRCSVRDPPSYMYHEEKYSDGNLLISKSSCL